MGGIFGQGRGGFEGDDGVLKRVALGEEGRLREEGFFEIEYLFVRKKI